MTPEKQYLSITALLPANVEALREIAHLIAHHGCSILNFHTHQHGDYHTINFLISGEWSVIAKLEPKFELLAKKLEFSIILNRVTLESPPKNKFPYILYVIAEDQPQNFHELMKFLDQPDITIQDILIDSYKARYTETPMSNYTIKIQFSTNLSIGDWRDRFMLFCDDMNFDAIMEPEKW